MLDRLGAIRNPCDLDLLLFFRRSPCALVTSELLVAHLGFDNQQIAKSLEKLIQAKFLTRSVKGANAARLYTLQLDGPSAAPLAEFLKIAATRQGRLDLRKLLASGPAKASGADTKPRPVPISP